MRRLVPFVVFMVVLVLPAMAAGEPCPPVDINLSMEEQVQTWWMVLLDFLLQLVAPIAVAVLTALAGVAVRKWGKKLDQDKQEVLVRLTDNLVTAGVAFAEEQGRKALNAGHPRSKGAEKMELATRFVQRQLMESGLPLMAEQGLRERIESRLAQERARPDGVISSDPDAKTSAATTT